jgi:hypothetical protein
MALVLNGDGNITGLTAGGLPDASITQAELAASVRGNMHGCFVRRNSNQTISSSTWTRIAFDGEIYDAGNCYDSSSNYRFQPTVAGYYFFQAFLFWNTSFSTGGACQLATYKNGGSYHQGRFRLATGADNNVQLTSSVYLNGSSDYLEFYVYQADAASHILEGSSSDIRTHFSAFLIGV